MGSEEVAPLIHIGYPKTATTTIQREFFAIHPAIEYLGKPYTDPRLKDLVESLMWHDDLYYDPDALRDHLVGKERTSKRQRVVLSDERLTSFATIGHGIVARRLFESFPDARILVSIRNQHEELKSWYLQRGRRLEGPAPYGGKHVSLSNWLAHSERIYPGGVFGALNYRSVIDHYAELFGRDRVHVVLFEDFTTDRPRFAEGLAAALDLDASDCYGYLEVGDQRPRKPDRLHRYQVFRNRLLPGVAVSRFIPGAEHLKSAFKKWLKRGEGARVELPRQWLEKVDKRFANGNAELDESFDLGLHRHGYPLPKANADVAAPRPHAFPS